MPDPTALDFPFRGRWMARNSPARRIPSHGTHLFGTTYAIDFVGVDGRGRSAPFSWGGALGTEAPDRFTGFGRSLLAPCSGRVVVAQDGEDDHVASRSPLSAIPYLLGQRGRAAQGPAAIAGNHVVIEVAGGRAFVMLAHLRRGSVHPSAGDGVSAGDVVGECGNSGNSIQPHVHVQVTDSTEWADARGLPMIFRDAIAGREWMPAESEIVEIR